VRTVWFRLDMAIDTGREPMRQTGLIDVRQGKARVVARRWTEDE
jgi:type II secretory pathway component PulK